MRLCQRTTAAALHLLVAATILSSCGEPEGNSRSDAGCHAAVREDMGFTGASGRFTNFALLRAHGVPTGDDGPLDLEALPIETVSPGCLTIVDFHGQRVYDDEEGRLVEGPSETWDLSSATAPQRVLDELWTRDAYVGFVLVGVDRSREAVGVAVARGRRSDFDLLLVHHVVDSTDDFLADSLNAALMGSSFMVELSLEEQVTSFTTDIGVVRVPILGDPDVWIQAARSGDTLLFVPSQLLR